MRPTNQKVSSDRAIRKREYRLYMPEEAFKVFFGHWFQLGGETYRIEGWFPQIESTKYLSFENAMISTLLFP
jgi:hypothetical protein